MKRIFSALLSVCLMASLAVPALAAPAKTSGAASTLRLESTEGTVQLKNAAGKKLNATDGTRLYNGYALTTKKSSYAYVSLDETKAVKLDASTSSEVFQSGKKLELKVNSGQIFFNVTAPLKEDESLTIRTSTIVTGVRGTCGWVETVDRHTSRISLLEGKLTVTSTDPLTKTLRTTTIIGGQTATVVYHGDEQSTGTGGATEDETIRNLIENGTIHDEHIILEGTGLTVESLQEEDVPGSVAVEVKNDPVLQQKIEENTELSVPEIIGDAEERVTEEETSAEAKDAVIQDTLEDLGAEVVDPVFEPDVPQEPSSGNDTTEVTPVNTTADLTNPTLEDLHNALTTEGITTVNASYTTNSALIPTDSLTGITIGTGQTLNISGSADVTNSADITVNGTMHVNNIMVNDGSITVNSRNSLHVNSGAELSNNGTIIIGNTASGAMTVDGSLQNSGSVSVQAGSTLTTGGTFSNIGTIDIPGTANLGGTITNAGTLAVPTGGSVTLSGTLENNPQQEDTSATISVAGQFTMENGSLLNNDTMSTGSCEISVSSSGTFTTKPGSRLLNPYRIINAGTFINDGTLVNGEFTNTGTVRGTGEITNDGGSFEILSGTCTVDNYDNTYGSLIVHEEGTMTVNKLFNSGAKKPDDEYPRNPTSANIYGTFILGGTCEVGEDGSSLSNYGTVINNSVSITPLNVGLRNQDGGQYFDNNLSEPHMLVSDSLGRLTAWGAIPSPFNLSFTTEESPFYDTTSQSETWLSGYTYTVCGPQEGNLNGYGAILPAVTANNVTLNLNGQLLHLSQTLTLQGGSLTVRDSGTNGQITSSVNYTVNVNGGNFVLESGSIVNTANSAITGVNGATPASTITIEGGSVYGNVYGIYTSVPGDSSIQPVTITVNQTDYTDMIVDDGGENFPVSGGSRAIEHV